VDPSTPEVSVGVLAGSRGDGVGTLLVVTLIEEGRRRGVPALSLSVEVENPALRLYERLGFVAVDRAGGALTMVLDLRT
jgi:ribosomal protein S18 acetylase RimI-like enzyme